MVPGFCNDIYDSLDDDNRNDTLVLLRKMNENNLTSVNTTHGLSERMNISDVVQQGGTSGPILCSNSTDKIGRICNDRKEIFIKYKDVVNTLPLTYVDDCGGVTRCGDDSMRLNAFLTTFVESKRLKFNEGSATSKGKCYKMHVGKNKSNCKVLKVHERNMIQVEEVKYLGEIFINNGNNTTNVNMRTSRE